MQAKRLFYSTYILTLLTIALTFQSCLIIIPVKKEESTICNIHNEKMHRSFDRTHYGLHCPKKLKKEYKNARTIHCMGCIRRSYIWALKYHCKQCTKLKELDKTYWENQD